jgi:hypothetical protein
MSIMAKYARIFWADPRDADVGARNRSVAALRDQFGALKSREAIDLAAVLVDALGGKLSSGLSSVVEKAISDESQAFELSGNEQQGTVCAIVAAMALTRTVSIDGGGWTAADAMAAALWSALALQDPIDPAPVEALRKDLLESCRDRVRTVAKLARKRQEVPEVGTLTISETEPTGGRAQAAYKRATAPVIKALKENAELDREEIDFLWWALADHSEVLDCPLADREIMCRAVAVGIDGAAMLRRLPSDGHRHVALRLVGESEELTLGDLVAKLGKNRAVLGRGFAGSWAAGLPTVFPLLAALTAEGEVSGPSVKLDARGWGARAMLEAAILRLEDCAGGSK